MAMLASRLRRYLS